MIRHSRGSLLALALMATVALSGCSVHQRLATQAVSFNLALEKSQNEMLLLNVIRAKDRLPMYLTGMSTLTGNVQTTLGATAGGSYTRARGGAVGAAMDTLTHAYTPSATASEMENPTYSLTVLDTQEFMRGFMSPLGKDTLAYYWDQSWPGPVLLYLLVERIEERTGKEKPVQVWDNYPNVNQDELDDLTVFGNKIRDFLAKKPTIEQTSAPEGIGPKLPVDNLQDLEELVKMTKEKLVVTRCNDHAFYRLQNMRTDFGFTFHPQGKPDVVEPDKPKPDPCDENASVGTSTSDDPLAEKKDRVATRMEDKSTLTFVLRSPEALLYYLGELMRVENRKKNPRIPEVCVQGHFQPLFLALSSSTCPSALLSAESTQGFFSIPAVDLDKKLDECSEDGALRLRKPDDEHNPAWPVCEAGRSMQAFRLLNQVMSLQKSAKDNPAPALVRVIGQ
jgi:hypothetical protein